MMMMLPNETADFCVFVSDAVRCNCRVSGCFLSIDKQPGLWYGCVFGYLFFFSVAVVVVFIIFFALWISGVVVYQMFIFRFLSSSFFLLRI